MREQATFAGGCFWCLESSFMNRPGVLATRCGYTQGKTANPSYKEVCTGRTGHAEAVEITFDPAVVSYESLVRYFLTEAHDPTQINRQGVDVGTQYRSGIYHHGDVQRETAARVIDALSASRGIVTELKPAVTFWPAEDFHQRYYEKYEQQNGMPHVRMLMKRKPKG